METHELILTFDNLQEVLREFVQDFLDTYKRALLRDKKKASGNLINSLRGLTLEFSNNKLCGKIEIASYWKYVEYGRRPGKFPPIKSILEWIKIKPVIPKPMNGLKPPTQPQLAFLISRKIARDGIKPGNQYTEALDICWKKWESKISEAISSDLSKEIDLITLMLKP